jgi:hypothetical protein
LIAVAAAIIIPTLHSNSSGGPTRQTVGIVGPLSAQIEQVVESAGTQSQDLVKVVSERSLMSAKTALLSNKIDLAVIGSDKILLNLPASAASSTTPSLSLSRPSDRARSPPRTALLYSVWCCCSSCSRSTTPGS